MGGKHCKSFDQLTKRYLCLSNEIERDGLSSVASISTFRFNKLTYSRLSITVFLGLAKDPSGFRFLTSLRHVHVGLIRQ